MRLGFHMARGEEERSTLVTVFSISSRDLCNRLGKSSDFPDESGSAQAPPVDAVLPDLVGLVWFLDFPVLPCCGTPSVCVVFTVYRCLSRRDMKETDWKNILWLLQSIIFHLLCTKSKGYRWKDMYDMFWKEAPTNFLGWLNRCMNVFSFLELPLHHCPTNKSCRLTLCSWFHPWLELQNHILDGTRLFLCWEPAHSWTCGGCSLCSVELVPTPRVYHNLALLFCTRNCTAAALFLFVPCIPWISQRKGIVNWTGWKM